MKETETKKTVTATTAKAEPVKTAKAEPVKTEAAKPAKAVKAEPAKKTEPVKAAKPAKTTEKKATTTKAKTSAGKKAPVTAEISIQFNNKAYLMEELVQSAKDRWKFDLKKKESELKSIELFIKPEDNRVYCVYNKEIEDSFGI